MNILMTNVSLTNDFGGPSIAFAFCDLCRANDASVKIGWLVGHCNDADRRVANDKKIDIIETGYNLSARKIVNIVQIIKRIKNGETKANDSLSDLLYTINGYDVLVDMGGLCFTDDILVKGVLKNLLIKREWIIAKKLGKKVVLYTTALGPIRRMITKFTMKMYLGSYCDYVILRDNESERLYLENKIDTPYQMSPDTAFMFNVDKKNLNGVMIDNHTIGISLSFQMKKQINNYMDTMENVCKYLLNKTYKIIFIANECSGQDGSDDEYVCKEMNNRLRLDIEIFDTKKYSAECLKAIISHCEVIIASRYHTLMASISSEVPTVALAWHPKYMDVMRMVKQEDYVVEKSAFNEATIINKFETLYMNKEKQKQILCDYVPLAKNKVIEANKEFMCGLRR